MCTHTQHNSIVEEYDQQGNLYETLVCCNCETTLGAVRFTPVDKPTEKTEKEV